MIPRNITLFNPDPFSAVHNSQDDLTRGNRNRFSRMTLGHATQACAPNNNSRTAMHFVPQNVSLMTGPKYAPPTFLANCNIIDPMGYVRESPAVAGKPFSNVLSATSNVAPAKIPDGGKRQASTSVEKDARINSKPGHTSLQETSIKKGLQNLVKSEVGRSGRNGSEDRCTLQPFKSSVVAEKGYRSLDKRENQKPLFKEEKNLEEFLGASNEKIKPRQKLIDKFINDPVNFVKEPISEKEELEIAKSSEKFSVPYSLKASEISSSPLIPPKNDIEHAVFLQKSEKKMKKVLEEVNAVINEETKMLAESANVWKENFYKVDELNKKLLEEIQQKQNQLSEISLNNQIVRKDNSAKDHLIEENKLIICDLKEVNLALKQSSEAKEKENNALREEIKALKEALSSSQSETEEKIKEKEKLFMIEAEKTKGENAKLCDEMASLRKLLQEKDVKLTEMECWANSIKRENVELESHQKETFKYSEKIRLLKEHLIEKHEDIKRKDDLIEKLMFELGVESCHIPEHLMLLDKVRELEIALEDMVTKTENLIIINQNLNGELDFQRGETERLIEIIQKVQERGRMSHPFNKPLHSSAKRSTIDKENLVGTLKLPETVSDVRGKLLDMSNSLLIHDRGSKKEALGIEKTPGSSSRHHWDYKDRKVHSSKSRVFEEDVQNLLSKISPPVRGRAQLFYDYSNISISDHEYLDADYNNRDSGIFDHK